MANPAFPPTAVPITPQTWTTRRGIAAASFCLGFWSALTFWMYPFGIMIGCVSVLLALISIVMGWRAGRDGEHLALLGLFFGSSAIGFGFAAYRFVQLAFEGTLPPFPFLF